MSKATILFFPLRLFLTTFTASWCDERSWWCELFWWWLTCDVGTCALVLWCVGCWWCDGSLFGFATTAPFCCVGRWEWATWWFVAPAANAAAATTAVEAALACCWVLWLMYPHWCWINAACDMEIFPTVAHRSSNSQSVRCFSSKTCAAVDDGCCWVVVSNARILAFTIFVSNRRKKHEVKTWTTIWHYRWLVARFRSVADFRARVCDQYTAVGDNVGLRERTVIVGAMRLPLHET